MRKSTKTEAHNEFLSLSQAEQASLSHVVELLSLILLTAIWAICPRDSLAVLGQWIQGKLVQVTADLTISLFLLTNDQWHVPTHS